jgi:ClpP class serine protease
VQVGFSKTVLSKGTYAELLSDNRSFTEAEEAYFEEAAQFAYRSFRDKAAASRGMEPEEIEEFAQGRVWLGSAALHNRCGSAAVLSYTALSYAAPRRAMLRCAMPHRARLKGKRTPEGPAPV